MSPAEALDRPSDSTIAAQEGLLHGRMRLASLIMTLYLCLLGGFALVMFIRTLASAPNRRPSAIDMADAVFLTVALQLALALLFGTPRAAQAIASEREGGTLDMLMGGVLSPVYVVSAKLETALAFPMLLAAGAVPLLVAAFLYAGLDLGQLALAEAVTVVTVAALASVAMALSAWLRRTVAPPLAAFGVALVLYVGIALVGAALDPDTASSSVHPLLFANPFYALRAIVVGPSPAGAHVGRLAQLLVGQGGEASSWGPVVQPWQVSVLAQAALAVVSLAVAVRLAGRRPLLPPTLLRTVGRRPTPPATEAP